MLNASQAKQLIEDSKHALDHLFEALREYGAVLEAAQKTAEEIEASKTHLSDLFMYRDQWSPNANHYYAEYMRRMEALEIKKSEAAKGFGVRLDNALKSIGATVESMSSLAGAVLQIAKQTLSLRHDGKPNIVARSIGAQSVIEVIWEGRNHSMHWDEGAPRARVQNMLNALAKDKGIRIEAGKNNSLSILGALGWQSTANVVLDLEALV